MKKYIKILLITALALIISGAAVVCLAFTLGRFKFDDLNTEKYEIKTVSYSEKISEIIVNISSDNVRIIPSTDGKTTVTYPESETTQYNLSLSESQNSDGYALNMTDEHNGRFHWFVINFNTPEIVVSLPTECIDIISVSTASGNIGVKNGIYKNNMNLVSGSGNIYVGAEKINQELTVNANSGNVRVENAEFSDLLIATGSGNISLSSVETSKLISNAASGNIKLSKCVADSIKLKTSSGNIILSHCDASELTLESSSGDIKGTILTPKLFVAESSSGNINVPKLPSVENTDGWAINKCVAKTASGNIRLEVDDSEAAE